MHLLGQMVGAGTLIQLLFGLPYEVAVLTIGIIMLVYVLFGGMIATTWVQIVKATLMLGGAVGLVALALSQFSFNPIALFSAASSKYGVKILSPGGLISDPLEALSLCLALPLGVASLPHVLMRFFTVPNARIASRSLLYATSIIGAIVFVTFILGLSAMVLVGKGPILAADSGGNMAVPLLAEHLGGTAFLGFIAAVSFATILAVVSGLMITGAATLSHDLWSNIVRSGSASAKEQIVVARTSTVLLAVIAIALGVVMKGQNVALLMGLSTAVAASANFPAIFLAIYWRRYNFAGAVSGMLVGLFSSLLLIYLSPTVQIDLLHHATAYLSLRNPGIISIPLAFLVSVAVSLLTGKQDSKPDQIESDRRMLIGVS